jgi:hypothetical protein
MFFAQVRVVVSDTDASHGANVAAAVDSGYGSDVNVLVYPYSLATSLSYANSIGADMVIRSYTGASGEYNTASSYYPNILTVMPSGSNDYQQVINDTIPQVIVLTGAGVDTNETAYNVEFNDYDPFNDPDLSSFSNGVIAGKLLKIYDNRNNGWWDARYSAQATASNFGGFTDKKGYGVINVNNAVAYAGEIITDPIINPPDPDSAIGAVSLTVDIKSYGARI